MEPTLIFYRGETDAEDVIEAVREAGYEIAQSQVEQLNRYLIGSGFVRMDIDDIDLYADDWAEMFSWLPVDFDNHD